MQSDMILNGNKAANKKEEKQAKVSIDMKDDIDINKIAQAMNTAQVATNKKGVKTEYIFITSLKNIHQFYWGIDKYNMKLMKKYRILTSILMAIILLGLVYTGHCILYELQIMIMNACNNGTNICNKIMDGNNCLPNKKNPE